MYTFDMKIDFNVGYLKVPMRHLSEDIKETAGQSSLEVRSRFFTEEKKYVSL